MIVKDKVFLTGVKMSDDARPGTVTFPIFDGMVLDEAFIRR